MCGRSSLTKTEKEIEARFASTFYSEELERYNGLPMSMNICPSQVIPVITNENPEHLQLYRWGLIPFWAKDEKIGYKMFNARKETLLEKPAFKHAVVSRRCMVVMDSFYEWKRHGKKKTPYRISVKSDPIFAVAGLWETWTSPQGLDIHSCTVITQPPNEFMAEIHDRMPAILTPETERLWIDSALPASEALQLIEPIESDDMESIAWDPVSGLIEEGSDNSGGDQLSLF